MDSSPDGWRIPGEKQFLTGLSQEHGILEQCGSLFGRTKIGDTLHIMPVHSCMTANLMREYLTLEGEKITTMNS